MIDKMQHELIVADLKKYVIYQIDESLFNVQDYQW